MTWQGVVLALACLVSAVIMAALSGPDQDRGEWVTVPSDGNSTSTNEEGSTP